MPTENKLTAWLRSSRSRNVLDTLLPSYASRAKSSWNSDAIAMAPSTEVLRQMRHADYTVLLSVIPQIDSAAGLSLFVKNSSIQVRRAVAENPHLSDEDREYLLNWAIAKKDKETLVALSERLPFERLCEIDELNPDFVEWITPVWVIRAVEHPDVATIATSLARRVGDPDRTRRFIRLCSQLSSRGEYQLVTEAIGIVVERTVSGELSDGGAGSLLTQVLSGLTVLPATLVPLAVERLDAPESGMYRWLQGSPTVFAPESFAPVIETARHNLLEKAASGVLSLENHSAELARLLARLATDASIDANALATIVTSLLNDEGISDAERAATIDAAVDALRLRKMTPGAVRFGTIDSAISTIAAQCASALRSKWSAPYGAFLRWIEALQVHQSFLVANWLDGDLLVGPPELADVREVLRHLAQSPEGVESVRSILYRLMSVTMDDETTDAVIECVGTRALSESFGTVRNRVTARLDAASENRPEVAVTLATFLEDEWEGDLTSLIDTALTLNGYDPVSTPPSSDDVLDEMCQLTLF